MSRAPLLAGNWKMHKTVREATTLVRELLEGLGARKDDREVLVCPPFTALAAVAEQVRDTRIHLGCQNVSWAEKGAFTGEVSVEMAKDVGCVYAIIGHSERRNIFAETDEMCRKKVRAALDWGIAPILCVGESLAEREAGETRDRVGGQVRAAVEGLSESDGDRLVIAYEPIWAIGTGKTDTPSEANKTCDFIRGVLGEKLGESVARKIRILYGGSVKPDNIDGFMAQADIDGALVGGASLDASSFLRIVDYR
jgi:triosephosphate isomerase